MAAINRTFMEYLVRRAGDARIAYTTATRGGRLLQAALQGDPGERPLPPDVYAGLTNSGKPANYPDTMEIENHLFSAIFIKGTGAAAGLL